MVHYMVDFVTVDDPSKMQEYARRAREIVESYGGEFVLRAGFERTLEGTLEPSGRQPTTRVVIRWPDADALQRMYNSPEYQAVRKLRLPYSTATVTVMRGLDLPVGGEQ